MAGDEEVVERIIALVRLVVLCVDVGDERRLCAKASQFLKDVFGCAAHVG